MSDWRKWWIELADKPVGFAIDDLRKLHEGYRLLAEAVEAERALREHQEECHWAQMDKPGACLDKSCMRLEEARDKAFEVALAHLRGVGRD